MVERRRGGGGVGGWLRGGRGSCATITVWYLLWTIEGPCHGLCYASCLVRPIIPKTLLAYCACPRRVIVNVSCTSGLLQYMYRSHMSE